MDCSNYLADLQKQSDMSRQKFAERMNVHVVQIRRYEKRTSQYAVNILNRFSIALPASDDARWIISDDNRHAAKAALEAAILKNQTAGAVIRAIAGTSELILKKSIAIECKKAQTRGVATKIPAI